MTKQEFIAGLRRGLSGLDDYEYINDTVNYYENYIETEIRTGKSEEEVMSMLGEPGLIAKSIKASKGETASYYESVNRNSADYEAYDNPEPSRECKISWLERFLTMPGWLMKLTGVAVLVGVISVITVVLHWLFPVFVVGGIAYLLYKFIEENFMR